MELFNLACAVDKAVRVIPSVIRVMAFLFSFILKYTVSDSACKDTGDGVFQLSIGLDWRWRGFNLARQWVHCCFAKPVRTKYVTHLHVLWEI